MVLQFTPPPQFRICALKRFQKEELHVTRHHVNSVLILMIDGVLRFREDGRDVELKKGEYYVQRDRLFQEGVRLGEEPVYYYIEFSGSYSAHTDEGLALRGRFRARQLQPVLEHLVALFRARRADPFLLNSYMNRVFSELWAANPCHDETAHVASRIRNELEARYAEALPLSELSRRFGYAEDYVIRIFKRHYGTTPHRYQITLRMEHARWLLENTALTVQEVSDAVGYRDHSAFWRAFRAHCGVTPGKLLR